MLLVALLPAAAVGQQHRHGEDDQTQQHHTMGMEGDSMTQQMEGGGMMGHSMGMGMMPMTGPSPTMILNQSEALHLGPDQVKELEALQSQARIYRESRMSQMEQMHTQLSETLTGDELDSGEYESVLQRVADQGVDMHVQYMALSQQALRVLSEEQRERLSSDGMSHRPMMGAEGMGEHPCPMAGEAMAGEAKDEVH